MFSYQTAPQDPQQFQFDTSTTMSNNENSFCNSNSNIRKCHGESNGKSEDSSSTDTPPSLNSLLFEPILPLNYREAQETQGNNNTSGEINDDWAEGANGHTGGWHVRPTPIANNGVEVVPTISTPGFLNRYMEDEALSEHLQSVLAMNNNNQNYSMRHRRTLSPLFDVDFGDDFDNGNDAFMSATEDRPADKSPCPPSTSIITPAGTTSFGTTSGGDAAATATPTSDERRNTFQPIQPEDGQDSRSLFASSPKRASSATSSSLPRAISPCGTTTQKVHDQHIKNNKEYDDDENDGNDGDNTSHKDGPVKQCVQWNMRYTELCDFKKKYGHCSVPYNYQDNLPLAQWVKRQRHQMKRKLEGTHSNLSPAREQKLTDLGFVWNAHKASWDHYFHQLVDFKERFGHCNVPTKFPENPQLAVWIKLQRRQFRLMKKSGSKTSTSSSSAMTKDRIASLESLGFVWNPRNLHF